MSILSPWKEAVWVDKSRTALRSWAVSPRLIVAACLCPHVCRLGCWWSRLFEVGKQSYCILQSSQKSHPAEECGYEIWIWLIWVMGLWQAVRREGKDRTMSWGKENEFDSSISVQLFASWEIKPRNSTMRQERGWRGVQLRRHSFLFKKRNMTWSLFDV